MAFVDAAVLMGAKPPTSSSISSSTNWLSLGGGVGSVGAANTDVGTASGWESAGEGTAALSLLEEGCNSVVASIPLVGVEEEETSFGEGLATEALLSADV